MAESSRLQQGHCVWVIKIRLDVLYAKEILILTGHIYVKNFITVYQEKIIYLFIYLLK